MEPRVVEFLLSRLFGHVLAVLIPRFSSSDRERRVVPASAGNECVVLQRQMAIERSAAAEAARAPATPTAAPLPAPTTVITLEHGEHFDSTLYR